MFALLSQSTCVQNDFKNTFMCVLPAKLNATCHQFLHLSVFYLHLQERIGIYI